MKKYKVINPLPDEIVKPQDIPWNEFVGNVARQIRCELGLTQLKAADQSSYLFSRAQLMHFEEGRYMPLISTVDRILGSFGLEIVIRRKK